MHAAHCSSAHHPPTVDEAITALSDVVVGEVIRPGDGGFDAARAAWNRRVDQHPAVIVLPATVDDVVHAVRFARMQRLAVAVQATGHGVAAPADGAVLIVTSRLDAVRIDPATRTAVVGAGARWRDVLVPARQHGLTALSGSSNDVGAVGYTLGGGIGWLARRFGLASDGVLSFELVTPDALVVTVSPDCYPELFWALKGGGAGLLGVVTAMEIELHAITTVYAGTLVFPVDMARDVFARWRTWVADIRPEMTSQVLVDRHGVSVRGCWAGDLAVGRAMLDEWRAWTPPVHDDWIVRATDDLEAIAATTDGVIPQGITNEWLPVVRDEVVDILIDAATDASGSPAVAWAGVRHAGGAIRSRSEAAVNGHGRAEAYLLELCGGTTETRNATRERLRPYVTGATMLNLVDGDERRRRTPTSFGPDQLARLRAVKTALDPSNRFRHGLAVEPVASERAAD